MKKLIIIFFIIWFSWISSYFFINFDHSYKKEVTIDGSNEYKLDDIKAYFLGFKLNVKTDIVETSYGYKYIYSARNFLGIKRKVEINVNIVDKFTPIKIGVFYMKLLIVNKNQIILPEIIACKILAIKNVLYLTLVSSKILITCI